MVLLGPPGAGKGTQAQKLAERLSLAHVASGDLFRQHQTRGTELGWQAQAYMERGELVPDQVTIQMVLERVQEPDCALGYILDGFPRTLEQARALDEALQKRGQAIDMALYIRVEPEELVRRLSGRLICRRCQTPYHRNTTPPQKEGVCDVCGGELYQREDDSTQAVRRRIQVYQDQTVPLVECYERQGKLRAVDGQQPIHQVTQALESTLVN